MEKIKIIFNKAANTLDIWFDDPSKEAMCEETGEELILKKDKNGNVIGVEKLNAINPAKKHAGMPMELTLQ
ncbi:MAG: DUF2283 domain-containing protein [Candidatus Micrarchaeota archaeon]